MIHPLLWLRAFAITVGIEELIAVPLLRSAEPSLPRRIGAVFVANLATHPLVWFFFPHLGWSYGVFIVVAETWAVGLEIVVYALFAKGARLSTCTAASALANAGSYILGLVAMRMGLI